MAEILSAARRRCDRPVLLPRCITALGRIEPILDSADPILQLEAGPLVTSTSNRVAAAWKRRGGGSGSRLIRAPWPGRLQ